MSSDGRGSFWSVVMRFSPVFVCAAAAAIGLYGATPWAPATAQTANPASTALLAEGERAMGAGDVESARSLFETALVADPNNSRAYIALGRIALRQQLPGQAIAYFRSALLLTPDSRSALAGQGVALMARGATDRARANLVRLQTLCGGDSCPEARELAAAINAGAAQAVLRPADVMPAPVVEQVPAQRN
jgi:Flp pilus assembly protein TadD